VSNTPVMKRFIRRTVDKHLPVNVHFDLTYRCNERCIHCYLDHEDYGEMTTAEVRAALDQLAAAGALFLTFSGGEIFLRKDLFELLQYARKLHFDLSLKTNALLVNEERAAQLRTVGVRRIQISVYSADPAVHDAITQVPGSLARSLEAIALLRRHGLQVKIACPLMKENLLAYRDVMKLAEELGVPYILDLTITPMMNGDRDTLTHRNAAEELLPVLTDAKLNQYLMARGNDCGHAEGLGSGNTHARPIGSATSSGIESDAYDGIPCSAGHNSLYISPYGDVFPCVQLVVPAGNLRRQRFEEIWYGSTEMRRVRAVREKQLPDCANCSIRSYCERCPGLALMEGGDLFGAYERACELAELHARLAGVENPISAFHARVRRSADVGSPVPDLTALAANSESGLPG